MNFESMPIQEQENKQRAFEILFEGVLQNKSEGIPTIDYNLQYPKEDFLKFLVENKNVLLHGSPNRDLEVLEPRQANDTAKESGNKKAVYAVTDPVMAIFFAIQNREKINGTIESGTWDNPETGEQEYKFKIPKNTQATFWTQGVIYIFDKNNFTTEKDNAGHSSGEWTSDSTAKPIAKIEIKPEDFQYLDKVEFN
ncbi:MAG: hypothetical protein Q8R55_04525 [Candidatus Taylorbacteria bacterium]|nr:hypothetical protein [Candidatus Taylorbacteria bacterium]